MLHRQNIVLIGMPGAGKSTLGVLLAKTLGMAFTDTDLLIQCREGLTLQNIIEGQGINRFLKIEEEIILALNCRETVVATGGSVVYSDMAMQSLKENGRIVYLRVPLVELKKRLIDMSTRGIAIAQGQTLDDLYRERAPLYDKYADVTIDSSTYSVEETLQKVLEKIR